MLLVCMIRFPNTYLPCEMHPTCVPEVFQRHKPDQVYIRKANVSSIQGLSNKLQICNAQAGHRPGKLPLHQSWTQRLSHYDSFHCRLRLLHDRHCARNLEMRGHAALGPAGASQKQHELPLSIAPGRIKSASSRFR